MACFIPAWFSRWHAGFGALPLSHILSTALSPPRQRVFYVLASRLLVLIPLAVAFAWAFFVVFERPFLSTASGREPEHEPRRDGPGVEAIRS